MQKRKLIIDEDSTGLNKFFKRGFTFVIVLLLSTLSINGYANSIQTKVTGRVTDESGMVLPGVNILVQGTSTGTTTDFDGYYSIQVDNANTVLVFSYLGMKTVEEKVNGRTVIDVVMINDSESLEEVVVVGYGTQKKSDVTGAVVSVPKGSLTRVPFTNFAQAIEGVMAGVSVLSSSGGAEQNNTNIMIRGRNSISASNSPLIVLDGIPFSGNFSDISTSDIASIEVLKDASSAAIYGSRGSNGVILITTKKGGKGKATISYEGSTGVHSIANLPTMLTPNEFYDFKTLRDAGAFTPSEEAIHSAGTGVDWVDVATRSGLTQQHTLSISGGSDNTKYFVSGSFLDVKGIAVNDDFTRFTSRLNLDTKVKDWLTIGTNTQYSFSDRSGLASDFGSAFLMNPLTKAFDDNGDLTIFPWVDDDFFVNPIQNTLASQSDKSFSIFSNNYLEIAFPFVKGLKYRFNTGVQLTTRNMGTYYGRNTATGLLVNGKATTLNNRATSLLLENIISYDKTFGKNAISFTGLYSFQRDVAETYTLRSQGFNSDVLTWYQANLATTITSSSFYKKETLISLMGRLNYAYDNKYLVTFTVRRDGFSGFGKNNKWGVFPSLSLGWNIHKENFFKDVSSISQLKLRLSYGRNGNQGIGAYESIARVSDIRFILDSDGDPFKIDNSYVLGSTTLPGFFPSKLGQPDLSWESTDTFNAGLDFGFLNNKIQGSLEAYVANTSDLLLNRSISSVHGITSIVQNIGEVKNTGFELTLNSHNISTDNFKWNSTVTLSHVKNEIVKLYGDGSNDILNKWFIGKPISSNYGFVFDGVWQTGDEFGSFTYAQPGYAKIKDANQDGIITDEDKQIQGYTDPDLFYGITNTLKYKNFTFSFFFQGVTGGTRANVLQRDNVWPSVRRNTMKKNWWTPSNPTNTHWSVDENANQFLGGVDVYESTDFLRLKDVSLSYELPASILEKSGFNKVRLSLNGRNLITITNWSGMDPEFVNQTAIPLQKEYSLGLVLGF